MAHPPLRRVPLGRQIEVLVDPRVQRAVEEDVARIGGAGPRGLPVQQAAGDAGLEQELAAVVALALSVRAADVFGPPGAARAQRRELAAQTEHREPVLVLPFRELRQRGPLLGADRRARNGRTSTGGRKSTRLTSSHV